MSEAQPEKKDEIEVVPQNDPINDPDELKLDEVRVEQQEEKNEQSCETEHVDVKAMAADPKIREQQRFLLGEDEEEEVFRDDGPCEEEKQELEKGKKKQGRPRKEY